MKSYIVAWLSTYVEECHQQETSKIQVQVREEEEKNRKEREISIIFYIL